MWLIPSQPVASTHLPMLRVRDALNAREVGGAGSVHGRRQVSLLEAAGDPVRAWNDLEGNLRIMLLVLDLQGIEPWYIALSYISSLFCILF